MYTSAFVILLIVISLLAFSSEADKQKSAVIHHELDEENPTIVHNIKTHVSKEKSLKLSEETIPKAKATKHSYKVTKHSAKAASIQKHALDVRYFILLFLSTK